MKGGGQGPGGGGGSHGRAVAIFGATSGIARPVAERLAAQGETLILIGRDGAALEAMAGSLERTHGRRPAVAVWDVLDHAGHAGRFRSLAAAHSLQGVFFAVGAQFPQDECERDPEKTRITMDTNLTGPAIILDLFAGHFRRQGSGWISCVSSVAGERGRGKVLAYGASKAGLTAYLDGLRHRLAGTGVFVQTIKPGFVRTRMTAGMSSPLMADAEPVARRIVAALRARREEVYVPAIWKWIMLIIRWMPNPIFRRMKF
jgi:decaprenylphospho-beta-D-erythro-pentofuranosid-2-ulose 2-reductase